VRYRLLALASVVTAAIACTGVPSTHSDRGAISDDFNGPAGSPTQLRDVGL
jgi:hypothetical protein